MIVNKLPQKALFISLSTLFIILQVVLLNYDSTSGKKLSIMMESINKAEKENISLNQKIASISAMAVISEKAIAEGLTDQRKIVSLTSPLPIAAAKNNSL